VACLHYRIATNLKSLLNYWITNGGMPQVHATAKNFFIYKDTPKPEGNTIDELRPISATSYFFKLLEIILKDRIERGFRTGMIKPLNQAQHGFRPGLGTEPQILKLILEAQQLMENRKTRRNKVNVPHLILVDLKSAFDSINWKIIGKRLKKFRVPTSIINTIEQLYSKTCTSPSDLRSAVKIRKGVI
jgi:hypothetical protein